MPMPTKVYLWATWCYILLAQNGYLKFNFCITENSRYVYIMIAKKKIQVTLYFAEKYVPISIQSSDDLDQFDPMLPKVVFQSPEFGRIST